jgi:hypothetical protein
MIFTFLVPVTLTFDLLTQNPTEIKNLIKQTTILGCMKYQLIITCKKREKVNWPKKVNPHGRTGQLLYASLRRHKNEVLVKMIITQD